MTRETVGAHYGIRDWLVQRVSAAVLAAYIFVLFSVLLLLPRLDYPTWKALFSLSWFRIFTLLSLLALCLHAWVGMREILMDYVHVTALRLFLQIAVVLSLATYALWALRILGGIA